MSEYPTFPIGDVPRIIEIARAFREMTDTMIGFAEANNALGFANGLSELHDMVGEHMGAIITRFLIGDRSPIDAVLMQIAYDGIPIDVNSNPYQQIRVELAGRLRVINEREGININYTADATGNVDVNRDA